MRHLRRTAIVLGLVAFGYLLGSMHVLSGHSLQAQQGVQVSKETADKLTTAREACDTSMNALLKDNLYVPAIEGLNSFASTTGGIDAIQDLKSGRGVDPETFAGLYAGLAVNEVAAKLTRDSDGRLLYEDKIVRLYPISRMQQLFRSRVNAPEDSAKPAPKANPDEPKAGT